jgi:NAD+ kinase
VDGDSRVGFGWIPSFAENDGHDRRGRAVKRIGLVAKGGLQAAASVLAELAGWLDAREVVPVFETETAALAGLPPGRPTLGRDELAADVDLVVVLGGDGTLLGMADRIAQAGVDIPILGVNFGSLGFLTEVPLPELYPALEAVLDGTAPEEPRLMLHARAERAGRPFAEHDALNDIVVTRGALSRIIDLSMTVGEEFVSRFRADGLIVATPTGSTAYNLAAGGPIVHPAVPALVVTPIAPHTLTNRPVVIPAGRAVRVRPVTDGSPLEIFVTVDGQQGFQLEPDDELIVEPSPRCLRLIRASSRTYFEVLREKLKWGHR